MAAVCHCHQMPKGHRDVPLSRCFFTHGGNTASGIDCCETGTVCALGKSGESVIASAPVHQLVIVAQYDGAYRTLLRLLVSQRQKNRGVCAALPPSDSSVLVLPRRHTQILNTSSVSTMIRHEKRIESRTTKSETAYRSRILINAYVLYSRHLGFVVR